MLFFFGHECSCTIAVIWGPLVRAGLGLPLGSVGSEEELPTARRVGDVLICSGNCCWLSDSAPGLLEAVAVAEEELAPCERELAPCGSGRFGRREALPMASFGWETRRPSVRPLWRDRVRSSA